MVHDNRQYIKEERYWEVALVSSWVNNIVEVWFTKQSTVTVEKVANT